MKSKLNMVLVLVACITSGCSVGDMVASGEKTPLKGFKGDWKPDQFRPREVRVLPPSVEVKVDHDAWIATNTSSISRMYSIILTDPSRQSEINVEYRRMDSPLGPAPWTYATYRYADPTNGTYIFWWRSLGKHKPAFLKLDNTPRIHLLGANQFAVHFVDGIPALEIIGIEGVGPKMCAY
jgi:hypothetical protein